MGRIIITYRLKPGVEREAFQSWIRSRDYPTLSGLRHLASFANHRVTHLLLDPVGKPSLDYVEMFDVPDVESFMASDFPTGAVQAILGEFMSRVDGAELMVGEEIS